MKKIIGYTTGVFDLFHVGHLNILRNAKNQCDHLIVGVTTDELCFSRKGNYPFVPFNERIEIVSHIDYVDEVVSQASMDKLAAWHTIRFDKMFVGDDWKGTPQWNALESEFGALGVEIVFFPYTKHTSSTKLREVLDSHIKNKKADSQ